MCGLVGYVDIGYDKKTTLKSFLKEGLYVDSLRGYGGTGVLIVDPDKEMVAYKRGVPGPDFLNSYQGALFEENHNAPMVAVGHNRAATVGAVNDKNSHPFIYEAAYGKIGLAHNGSLENHFSLTPTTFKHQVDSAHAAYCMALKGPEETLASVRGWYVFIWYDAKKNTFNMARNSNRDISFAYLKDHKGLIFASEWPMLDWLAWRNDLELEKETTYTINENSWLSWNLADKVLKPKIKPIKLKEPPKPTYPNYSYGGRNEKDKITLQKNPNITCIYYKGDTLNVVMKKWEAYPVGSKSGARYGTITGVEFGFDKAPVMIQGVKESEWEYLKDFAECKVLITAAKKIDDQMVLIASLKGTAKDSAYGSPKSSPIVAAVERHTASPKPDNPEPSKALVPVEDAGELPEYTEGPRGEMMLMSAMKMLTENGCRRCQDPISPQDGWLLLWTNETPPSPICKNCAEDTETQQFLEDNKIDLIDDIDK